MTAAIRCRYDIRRSSTLLSSLLEVLEKVPADPHRQVVLLDERILEPADAALPVEQLLPGGFGIDGQRRRRRHAGDDDIGKSVTRCQRCHRCRNVLSDGQYRPKASATLWPPKPKELLIA